MVIKLLEVVEHIDLDNFEKELRYKLKPKSLYFPNKNREKVRAKILSEHLEEAYGTPVENHCSKASKTNLPLLFSIGWSNQ